MNTLRRRIIVSAALPAAALGFMLAGPGLASAAPTNTTTATHATTASTISIASQNDTNSYRHHRDDPSLDLSLLLNLNLGGHHSWNGGGDCGCGDDGGYYHGGYYHGGLLGGIL